jgi:hypothetical protein
MQKHKVNNDDGMLAPSRTLDLHFVKEIKGRNFVMIKRNKNIKLKKKGNQLATCCPVQGRLMSLY